MCPTKDIITLASWDSGCRLEAAAEGVEMSIQRKNRFSWEGDLRRWADLASEWKFHLWWDLFNLMGKSRQNRQQGRNPAWVRGRCSNYIWEGLSKCVAGIYPRRLGFPMEKSCWEAEKAWGQKEIEKDSFRIDKHGMEYYMNLQVGNGRMPLQYDLANVWITATWS